MVVQHNITAMNANRYYGINNSKLASSLEKLSSGYKINRAGDDAAGLAVSEKMRSQIAGLNQGVKNAQDGISMIQTFEGALTETDSILQRMKTLADQAANGTYQDDVDREAIQLEFNQLNDELDQIADTDFNGVIALNGGTMADGLEYTKNDNLTTEKNPNGVGGNFIYYSSEASDTSTTTERTYADGVDYAGDATSTAGTDILQNAKYDKTDADYIWETLGLTPESTDVADPDKLQITFTYDGSDWVATGVLDGDGKEVEVDAEKLAALKTTKTDNGGFTIDGTSLNLVFDTTKLDKFDTATVEVQNVDAAKYAPTNVAIKEDSATITTSATTDASKSDIAQKITVSLDSSLNDDAMNADMKLALDGLQSIVFQVQCSGGNAAAATISSGGSFADSNGTSRNYSISSGVVSWSDGTNTFNLAKVDVDTATNLTTGTTGTMTFSVATDAYEFTDTDGLTASSMATPEANKPTEETFAEPAADTSGKVSFSDAYSNGKINLTYTNHIVLQTGARSKDSVDFTFQYTSNGIGGLTSNMDCSSREDGLNTANLNLSDAASANEAIDQIDWAINKVSMVRATFGAVQNRLEHKIDNMNVTIENLTDAESGIRDTDMSTEMMEFTKNQILSQAAQSMLAQANTLPQSVLSLLQ